MSEEKKGNDFLPNLGVIATSDVSKWADLSWKGVEKSLWLNIEVKGWVIKLLDLSINLKPKTFDKDFFNVDEYVEAISKAKKCNIEITDETKNKLIDFVDFFWDILSDWIIEELDNTIFNWNPDLIRLLAYMKIDSEENWEIYKQLIPILQEIKVS